MKCYFKESSLVCSISHSLKPFLLIRKVQATPIESPCASMPCGLNSQCRELNGHAVCSCLPEMIGAPPNCRPECLVSSECPLDKSCVNQICKNPCEGVCGLHARCQVVNHNPICSCELGFNGDPFIRCVKEEKSKDLYPSLSMLQRIYS